VTVVAFRTQTLQLLEIESATLTATSMLIVAVDGAGLTNPSSVDSPPLHAAIMALAHSNLSIPAAQRTMLKTLAVAEAASTCLCVVAPQIPSPTTTQRSTEAMQMPLTNAAAAPPQTLRVSGRTANITRIAVPLTLLGDGVVRCEATLARLRRAFSVCSPSAVAAPLATESFSCSWTRQSPMLCRLPAS